MLRGKSPCLGAESVSGRPLGPSHGAGGEALSGATVPGLGPVAAAQACRERSMRSPTERGSLSPCPLFLWHSSFHNHCLGALLWRVVVIQTLSFMTQGVTMRRTFLQGQQLSTIYCEILKLFAVCPWWASCVMCSFRQEGRGSTASQRTDGELAPIHAAGKVPVPWGRAWGQSQQHRHAVSVR
ncbi:unnamed protein product [Polarella glacialis]|uniref:Uncharacterized protein n=1 Tax=Polarella glacialis TaxID=89957 RepID=A0A813DAX4_POLGL|nr:unnamed protein product [Polarella glacialis]